MEYEPCLENKNRPLKKLSGPDGLEAWCVAFAALVINFIMAGIGRMSGILYVAFIDIFQIGRKEAALPFSVRSSVRNLLGPVVGILGQKYGVGKITLLGGITGTISAACCFYVKDILWVTIVWGAINGISTALTTTLPQVVIGQHFKKYRTTASGMAFSGGCVGSFLFPALLEFLLHSYGLGGTYLIIAGIIMHTIPAAMLLRTPSWIPEKTNDIHITPSKNEFDVKSKGDKESPEKIKYHAGGGDEVTSEVTDISNVHSKGIINGDISKTALCLNTKSVDISFLREHEEIAIEILMNGVINLNNLLTQNKSNIRLTKKEVEKFLADLYSYIEFNHTDATTEGSFGDDCKTSTIDRNLNANKGIVTTENDLKNLNTVTYSHLIKVLKRISEIDPKDLLVHFPEDQQSDVSQTINEMQKLYSVFENLQPPTSVSKEILYAENNNSQEGSSSNTFLVHIKTALRLNTKPIFILICMCRTVHFLTFMPVVTAIVDFSMDKGLLEEDGKYVIAALSLGDLVGRLCFGWITDRGYVSLPRYMMLVMIVQGASTATLPLMHSRATLMTSIAVFGLLQGSVFVRHPVLVSKYLGTHEQSIAMGCINFYFGILAFGFPSYIGYFRDNLGSYDGIFYINGGIGAFVGLLWIFEPHLLRWSGSEDNEDELTAV